VSPGLSPKLYPSCSESHAAVDAILNMRAEGLRPADVVRIRCGMTPAAVSNLIYHQPRTPLEGKFSQEYCVAVALARGRLGLAEFVPDALQDPTITQLLDVTEAKQHPDLSGVDSVAFSSPAIVEVETRDGKVLKKVVREMKGHPNNPLTVQDLQSKFIECAAGKLSQTKAANALSMIENLESVRSVADFVSQLRSD
jgi:2-methylcitrate dehydratase PrpD